jgi:serine/threonine protein kinase
MAASEQVEVQGPDRADLVRRLTESHLLTPDEIDRIGDKYPDATGKDLASAFIEAGLLTKHQMAAIAAGKPEELRIGNYDILDRLGAGGMGTVFKARHRRMKRVVALKVLLKSLSQDTTFIQRFQREVETIAQLSHPNIVMAYDADEADIGHFLVMEFVNGHDLANVVQKQGPMSVRAAVESTLQAARGLEYAHAQNIIHRDIKPANLLRDAHGIVKITDLGLARLSADPLSNSGATAAASLTQAGGILGTADYMPPEQAVDSASIDHRADIYSLGVTLFFLLTGQTPYAASSMMATLIKHREAPIPSLVDACQGAPAELDDLFRRMLAKDPRDRQQTMTQVVTTLEATLKNLGAVPLSSPSIAMTAPVSERPTDVRQDSEQTLIAAVKPTATSVLLVEPSRTQAGIIRRYLQSLDVAHIVSAASGADALAAIRANCPDVILCAMHLNDRTGIQLAQQIRAEFKSGGPGFILISSESDGKDAAQLTQVGHSVILHKPFTIDSLIQALKVASPVFAHLKSPSVPTAVSKPRNGRVLIVDDSTPARLHIRNVLAGLGLTQCVEAADGAQAVAVLAREKFDLIFTDFNMPLMDGGGLVAYLKQNPATAAVPIIMVTTETDPAKLDPVRRLGVTICPKSFPVDVARKIIDTLLRE